MCMKINELSLNPRSKTEVGRVPKTALVLSSQPFRLSGGGLGGRNSVFHRCRSGDREQLHASRQRTKSRAGGNPSTRDVKNEGTSGDVHENKGQATICPTHKDAISAWLHVILHGNTRILQKSPALVSQFERWRTHRSLQNEETRVRGRCLHLSNRLPSRVRIVRKLSSWLNRLAKRRGMEPTVRWSGGGL